jgi:hypothetical protein
MEEKEYAKMLLFPSQALQSVVEESHVHLLFPRINELQTIIARAARCREIFLFSF